MSAKLEVHYDFVVVAAICFALLAGFNLYQRRQYNDLLSEHTALQWTAQDMEVNQAYSQRRLEKCENTRSE